ncbi:MAG: PIG-L family deacetylase, partial [Candidatus Dormibacteraceae bacterium]
LMAHQSGHRVVLVTCTGGEEGEIHNLDEAATRPRLAEVRAQELARAGEILGVDRQEFLGYRDSGMAGEPSNQNQESFHQADLRAAGDRLIELLRQERPEVVITYTPDGTYGHPDHLKAHQTTVSALDRLADTGWQPEAFYFHAISRSMVEEMGWEETSIDRAEPLPVIGVPDEVITTHVDVRDLVLEKRQALDCHLSQIDPAGQWASITAQVWELAMGREHYILNRGRGGVRGDVFTLLP